MQVFGVGECVLTMGVPISSSSYGLIIISSLDGGIFVTGKFGLTTKGGTVFFLDLYGLIVV